MRNAILNLALLGLLLGACSGSSDNIGSNRQALTGPIDVRMTDVMDGDETPPATSLRQIVVTIVRVDVRRDDDDGWTTVSQTTHTIDLLSLTGTTFTSLGISSFPAGHIEAIRVFVSDAGPNYVVTGDGVTHTLIVPSGDEAGIKLVGDFDVEPCATGEVTLEFAARKSVFVNTNGDGTWMLRSVIRLKEIETSGTCPEGEDGEDNGDRAERKDVH